MIAAVGVGLSEREAERTIRSGLDAGERVPRSVPAEATAAAAPDPQADRATAELVVLSAADVKVEPVEWLLPDRVPVGMLTLLAGDPDLGKSTFTCLMAAQVSRGELGPAGNV